jgi:hypothetical protein
MTILNHKYDFMVTSRQGDKRTTGSGDVKMALKETHGGESRTTGGDICRSLPAGKELFIDPRNTTQAAREQRSGKRYAEFSATK